MKMRITHLLLAVGLLSLPVSCLKEKAVAVEGEDGQFISIKVDAPTKGFVDASNLASTGTKVKVFDYLTGFTGTSGATTVDGGDLMYIDDQLEYGSSSWDFSSGTPWPWTRTGTHHFFGWLVEDASVSPAIAASGLNPAWNAGSRILTIPDKVLTTGTEPQFDFCYSDIALRTAASKDYSSVSLPMHHLFAALAITVSNASENQVKIHSITMPNLPNSANAMVDYSGDEAVLNQSTASVGATPFFSNQFSDTVLDQGDMRDVFTGNEVSATNYKFIWPVPAETLAPTRPNPYSGITDPSDPNYGFKDSRNNPADSLIRISYSFFVPEEEGGSTGEWIRRDNVGVKLPYRALVAGTRTYINVSITDQVLDLTFEVQDWDYNQYLMDFSVTSVTVTQDLQFKNGTFDAAQSTLGSKPPRVYTNGSSQVQATFKITSPVGARIMVEPLSAAEFFDLSISPSRVDPSVEGGTVTLTITPHGAPTTTQTLTMRFLLVMGSGSSERVVDLSSDLNRDNYNIIWNRN